MSARTRSVVLVGALTGERKATHTGGHRVIQPDKLLPLADVLLIVADDEPGVMLFRYTTYGESAGDTWHATVDEARAHAEYEYGNALILPWMDVPEDVADPHMFAAKYALDRLNDRGRW
ncbi:MAG TPA: hypothetical protein VMM18_15705 [Gemmatimonadaceae bacterium]|nr:hypothetical protein [Gemmatimonadaceae bacterium]